VEAEAPPGWETDSEAGEETTDEKESLAVDSEASVSTMEACERSGSSPGGSEGAASSLEDTEAPCLILQEGDTSGGGCKDTVDVPERGQDVQDSEGFHKREHVDQFEQDHHLYGSPTDMDKKCPEANHFRENEVAYDGCVGSLEKIRAEEAPNKAETCEEGGSTSAHWRFWEVLGSVVGIA